MNNDNKLISDVDVEVENLLIEAIKNFKEISDIISERFSFCEIKVQKKF